MYEMWGATGVTPWAHTWSDYKRIFTGWRRHRWEHTGQICLVVANGLLPRKDRRSWKLTDFCSLFKAPPRWKAVAHMLEHLDQLFGGYMEALRDGRFDFANADIIHDVRERLIRTLEAVGISRLDTLEALDEQRELFIDVTEPDVVVVTAV